MIETRTRLGAMGAGGLAIAVHRTPDEAKPARCAQLMNELRPRATVLGRSL